MSNTPPEQREPRVRRAWYKTAIRKTFAAVGPGGIAFFMVLLRWTCRTRMHNDPRQALQAEGVPYVYSVLHAQQLAAATCGHRGTAAMVSQSLDGALVAFGLKCVGIIPIRGSSSHGQRNNGGLAALDNLIKHVRAGGPAYLAVDGPRGPRNRVHKGIAVLSRQANAAVINVVVVPSRRWIIGRSWDRLQVPVPFCRIDTYFGAPLRPQAGETAEAYRRRIEADLNALEALRDPTEAALAARARAQDGEQTTGNSAAA